MFELIALFIMARKNGKRVYEKGYSKSKYILLTIGLYFLGELVGGVIGNILFEDILIIYLIALIGGITGGVFSSRIVSNLPYFNAINKRE